ncbi:polyamine-transporting ATPase [Aureimonas endophytica]|uniref:Spermidine/putrescine import ATP-binding protein PotA n=1 Tax=Aureimonas endophytica TaxID=2027858 RepID=A0A916ZK70_9HYPH|nr:ABC transporter ATP-binding protein [Aureimonas endophytica]GGE01934.1 polyamine-transporting ATPase [Aureimonas endophytica]
MAEPHAKPLQERSDTLVRFDGVEKTYDGVSIVVKRLDLDIRRGEFLTMLGPSGSGKTTCLMMLAGFETPTAGTILLDGRPIERLPPHKRGIGVVFQNYALFPHMSVADNVGFPLRMRGLGASDKAARVARALDMVQMGKFADRRPAQLSGGQQQRIALARALVFEPALVLMDEPLGALDKQLREHMQIELKHLHERLGVTVVYVTHDQGEALTMSDRIAVFNDGRVQQLGTATEIYERPSNPFVARFIGDNNAIRGQVVDLDAGTCTVSVGQGRELVRASAVPGLSKGAATTLSIRPERLTISPTPATDASAEATVREVIYLGDHIRVRVAALGSDSVEVKLPSSVGSPSSFEPGQRISIGWNTRDCRALPDN